MAGAAVSGEDYIPCRACGYDVIKVSLAEKIVKVAVKNGRKPAPYPCDSCGALYDIVSDSSGRPSVKAAR